MPAAPEKKPDEKPTVNAVSTTDNTVSPEKPKEAEPVEVTRSFAMEMLEAGEKEPEVWDKVTIRDFPKPGTSVVVHIPQLTAKEQDEYEQLLEKYGSHRTRAVLCGFFMFTHPNRKSRFYELTRTRDTSGDKVDFGVGVIDKLAKWPARISNRIAKKAGKLNGMSEDPEEHGKK